MLSAVSGDGSLAYGAGRVFDRAVLKTLSWYPGTGIEAWTVAGVVLFRPAAESPRAVAGKFGLTIPGPLRLRCGLRCGDRVLLVAIRAHDLLIAYPPAVLDRMVTAYHSALAPPLD